MQHQNKGGEPGVTLQSCLATYRYIQLRGNDKAVLVQCLYAFSVNRQWEGLIFLGVKGLEGCMCLCYQSPAAKSY